jgi:ATP-dependent DNA ligase
MRAGARARYEGSWIGHHRAIDRFNTLRRQFEQTPRVHIVAWTLSDYPEFFEHSKTLPGVEGIVLKRTDSKYIGSVRQSVDNPGWMKVKWREGADGQVRVA